MAARGDMLKGSQRHKTQASIEAYRTAYCKLKDLLVVYTERELVFRFRQAVRGIQYIRLRAHPWRHFTYGSARAARVKAET
jgi:hypothetical protein